MLFFSGGYNNLSKNSFDAGVNAWVGQSYLAADASAKFTIMTATPSYIMLRAVVSRQKFHEDDNLFFNDATPNFVTDYETFGRLSYCLAAGLRGKVEISAGAGHLIDRYYRSTWPTIRLPASDMPATRHRAPSVKSRQAMSTAPSTIFPTPPPAQGYRHR